MVSILANFGQIEFLRALGDLSLSEFRVVLLFVSLGRSIFSKFRAVSVFKCQRFQFFFEYRRFLRYLGRFIFFLFLLVSVLSVSNPFASFGVLIFSGLGFSFFTIFSDIDFLRL